MLRLLTIFWIKEKFLKERNSHKLFKNSEASQAVIFWGKHNWNRRTQGICNYLLKTLRFILFLSQLFSLRQQFSKVWPGDPWSSQRLFQEVYKVSAIFTKYEYVIWLYHSNFLTSVHWSLPEAARYVILPQIKWENIYENPTVFS